MNVWIVNLKDDRGKSKNNSEKFELCKEKSIIAIGWAVDKTAKTWEEYKDNIRDYYKSEPKEIKEFNIAVNAFEEMKPGDLVWTRNPATKEYYICKILSDFEPSVLRGLEKNDISVFRSCEYIKIGCLPTNNIKLTSRNLTSLKTVIKVHNPAVIEETKMLVKETE